MDSGQTPISNRRIELARIGNSLALRPDLITSYGNLNNHLCYFGFSRKTEPIKNIHINRFTIKNWLMLLWRLRSSRSSVSKLDTQENQCFSTSLSPKAWTTRRTDDVSSGSSPSLKAREDQYTSLKTIREKEFFLTQLFILFRPPEMDWMWKPIHIGESSLFCSVYWFTC